MKKHIIILLLTGAFLSVKAQTKIQQLSDSKAFVHPGMAQNRQDLELMKKEALLGVQPWKAAFDRLKSSTPTDYITHPVSHLSQGPYGSSDLGGKELMKSSDIAYSAAILWYITGKQEYANEATGIINAWSYTLWDLSGNNAKLLAGLSGHFLLNAAEILKYSNSGWKVKDAAQFKFMMLTVYYPLIKDFFPEANGNWDASMINTMMCLAVFCEDHAMFNRAVTKFYIGNGNGGITKYIYPGGQIQEATRDWGHVQLGLGEFAKAAQTAWTQGIDLYSVADNRLARGFEYASKYLLGGNVPVYGPISERERGTLRDIYENVYNHYHFTDHLNMPYTGKMMERTRAKTSQVLLTNIHTVPHEDGKYSNLPEPGTDAIRAGASEKVEDLPADAVRVKPGEPIQSALDNCKPGGTVLLLKGVHTISAGLLVPSNITLCGEGLGTILFFAPTVSDDIVLKNKVSNMHDVTIRDLLIEGATSAAISSDPNNDRRIRAYESSPSRGGILFAGTSDSLIHNIVIDHITVQNCTKSGIYISGCVNLTIHNCDFSDNGSWTVPGGGQHHNLRLLHVEHVQVNDTRLDSSPWGNGCSIIAGNDIIFSGNETERNKLNGIYCLDVKNLHIINNLAEGNDQNGIYANGENVQINSNISRNNAAKGIASKEKALLQHNILSDNGM